MTAAQRTGEHQIGRRSRRVDKVTRILDDDIRLVAISGQLVRNLREQIVDDAHYPRRAVVSLRRGPFLDLSLSHPKDCARRQLLVASTERARLSRAANFFRVKLSGLSIDVVAPAKRERKALAAHIDNI